MFLIWCQSQIVRESSVYLQGWMCDQRALCYSIGKVQSRTRELNECMVVSIGGQDSRDFYAECRYIGESDRESRILPLHFRHDHVIQTL